ncbi:MAG: DUF3071 domain-containing protein, partial [Leucobacter sp.]
TSQLPIGAGDVEADPEPSRTPDAPSPLSDSRAEYERRREIDQRAIKTNELDQAQDLSQTADLLDALRKRRGERDRDRGSSEGHPARGAGSDSTALTLPEPPAAPSDDSGPAPARSIWQAAGVTGGERGERPRPIAVPAADDGPRPSAPQHEAPPSPREEGAATERETQERPNRKGRASIPSWDDILFGTRSDEDPA